MIISVEGVCLNQMKNCMAWVVLVVENLEVCSIAKQQIDIVQAQVPLGLLKIIFKSPKWALKKVKFTCSSWFDFLGKNLTINQQNSHMMNYWREIFADTMSFLIIPMSYRLSNTSLIFTPFQYSTEDIFFFKAQLKFINC